MSILEKIHTFPELEFVILCSCVEPDTEKMSLIKKMGEASLDWDLIYNIAFDQRTLPLLSRNIRSILADTIPSPVADKLKSFSFQNMTRNLFAFNFLLSIVRMLNKNDISVIPFKGLLTAHSIYGDIGLRSFADLDLLVKKDQAFKAWVLLKDNGFSPELNLDNHQIKKYIHVEDNISFQFKKNNLTVELHWEASGFYLLRPLLFEDLKKRAGSISIHDKNFLNLSSEDLLLYLCIHGAKHGWEYLELICCISELLKQNALDWNLVEDFSQKWKCSNMLYLGLSLAIMIFKAPIPDAIYTKIIDNTFILGISETVLGNMFKNYGIYFDGNHHGRFSNFHLKIRDSLLDQLHYFLRLAFRPTKKEWISFPVPARLSFLHYFLRPYRLIKEGIIKQHA